MRIPPQTASRPQSAKAVLCCLAMLLAPIAAHAQVSLGSAIDLALRSSDQVLAAQADRDRAAAALSESKDAYVPSVAFSTGAAKGTGFPLGDPSVAKVTAQGLVYNAAQPQFIHAAREAVRATGLQLESVRQQVILDAATTYAELAADEQATAALAGQEAASNDMVRIEQDRADAGLESRLAVKKTQLHAAQARLKRLDMESRADVLRLHLSALTGIPAAGIHTEPQSLPSFPAMLPQDVDAKAALDSDVALRSAYAMAKSKQLVARGQRKLNFRPEVDLILQYGYIDDFNDYSRFYNRELTPNNAVVGVQVTLPIFNRAQSAKAREADADAARALHQANQQRSLIGEQLQQLRHAVEQTAAAAEVAQLQHEISVDTLDALRLRSQNAGEPNTANVAPTDVAAGTMEERGLLVDQITAEFDHTKAQLEWMRANGTLTDWAKAALATVR